MQSDNGFKLEILDGQLRSVHPEYIEDNAYFPMHDNETYSIHLTNVDGKDIGFFRIEAKDSITIERPAGQQRKLVFVAEESCTARRAGVRTGRQANGLIEVTFVPEHYHHPVMAMSSVNAGSRASGMAMATPMARSGATILGQKSNQRFFNVSSIEDIDHENKRTLRARMIAVGGGCRPTYPPEAIGNFDDDDLNHLHGDEEHYCGHCGSPIPPRIESWK
jgi:hypothetical protein